MKIMKRIVPNSLKEHKESKVLETKADKIIFTAAVAAYTIVMLLELKFTPHHNTISSSIAAFGVSTFLISKAVHKKKTTELILWKDRIKWLAMPAVSAVLIASGIFWLAKEYLM